ncbi:DUF2497 domain-containing protein [Denitrobaculum tricleocarpae]|uniref:DUF2497 domain-containing protein n=1 Tax=Denitrobaculum tricleocarpae TaxID=2591009 RepID=A0A545TQ45_9PROT|nr:DUF2497 domain-containing protein [Denitrobaculum tricleocarpae]TQV79318.1 DUF2497 domain-containing protein [Denitrobaculum tricleocarpae]
MSDQQNQDEPSMEEILASIRRIISEDDPEEGEGEKAEAAEAETPEEDAQEDADTDAGEDSADDEEEELELTEKVNPDGSEIGAEPEEQAAEAEEEIPEPKPILDDDFGEAEVEPEPEPEPEPEEVAAEAEPETLDVALEPDEDLPPVADDESLISEPTQVAASTALSEIAKAALTQRALMVGDGRTIEDLVREALRPELKLWLDANLASMVERIVREEIKKMVRRVENQ